MALVALGLVLVAVVGVGVLVATRPFSREAGAAVVLSVTSSAPAATAAASPAATASDSGGTSNPGGASNPGGGAGSPGTSSAPAGGAPAGDELPATLPATAVSVRVPILMYHYVDDEPPPMGPYADSLTVRTPEFRKQLDYLAAQGYRTLTLGDVYRAMAEGAPLQGKAIVITFDDGGLDNYTHAFPLLKEKGFVGTFFVITEEIGRPGYMTWDMVREMAAAGMSIQSHTAFHSDLRGTTEAKLKAELLGSRNTIEEEVGVAPYALCYPAGAYDERVMAAVRDAGYLMAVTTKPGKDLAPNRLMELPRIRISPGMGEAGFAEAVK